MSKPKTGSKSKKQLHEHVTQKKIVKKIAAENNKQTKKTLPIPSDNEKYMSAKQLKYFKNLFENMRNDILQNAERMILAMKDNVDTTPDDNDRASKESEFSVALRGRDRERRLLAKIDAALSRIEKKNFGYCSDCGDSIGLQRILARPVATLCIECKSLQERYEKNDGVS